MGPREDLLESNWRGNLLEEGNGIPRSCLAEWGGNEFLRRLEGVGVEKEKEKEKESV